MIQLNLMINLDKQQEGRTCQTLFQRTRLATTEGPAGTTAVDWYLKVKDIKYNVDLTRNYCISILFRYKTLFINLYYNILKFVIQFHMSR